MVADFRTHQLMPVISVIALLLALLLFLVPFSHAAQAAASIALLLALPTGLGLLFFSNRAVEQLGLTAILLISHFLGACS